MKVLISVCDISLSFEANIFVVAFSDRISGASTISGCSGQLSRLLNQEGPFSQKSPSLEVCTPLVPRSLGLCSVGTYFQLTPVSSFILLTLLLTNTDQVPLFAN